MNDKLQIVGEIIDRKSTCIDVTVGNHFIELRSNTDIKQTGVDMVRDIGSSIIEEGYYIAGLREIFNKNDKHMRIWVNELPENSSDPGRIVGTVNTNPEEGGDVLLDSIAETHTIELDTIHDDGNMNFIIRE